MLFSYVFPSFTGSFQLGAQLAQCTASRAFLLLFFLSACHARAHFREPRSSNLLYHHSPNPFFAQWTVSFAYETASWRYFVSKIFSRRQERDRKSEKNERKTQLPRLGGDFSMGKFECYCIYLHYILLQFDLSSALSRGRKSRHSGLALWNRVTPDSSTDSRHFSSYFYSTVVATRNIAIDVSAKEVGRKGGDAFLRQFITRAGSRNLFEHLIHHSWNVKLVFENAVSRLFLARTQRVNYVVLLNWNFCSSFVPNPVQFVFNYYCVLHTRFLSRYSWL